MANFLDFSEIASAANLPLTTQIVGIKSDNSEEVRFSVDVLFDKFSSEPLSLSPSAVTGSSSTSSLEISQTWNTTGSPSLFKINLTNTASDLYSRIFDIRIGSSTILRQDRTGQFILGSTYTLGPNLWLIGPDPGISFGVGAIGESVQGGQSLSLNSLGLYTYSHFVINWRSSSSGYFGASKATLSSPASWTYQFGTNHATVATDQTIKAHNVTTGVGAALILQGGTGSVTGGDVRINQGIYDYNVRFTAGAYSNRLAFYSDNTLSSWIDGQGTGNVTTFDWFTSRLTLGHANTYIRLLGGVDLYSNANHVLQLGLTHADTPTNQKIKAHDVTTGIGADLELEGGSGSSANGRVKATGLIAPILERNVGDSAATLVLADQNKVVSIDSSSSRAWNIPTNADVPFPIGTVIAGECYGSGGVVITPAGGVTLLYSTGLNAAQNCKWAIRKVSTDTWSVVGELTA